MKIGIIGTGRIGSGLGKLWAESGHTITLGSRDTAKARTIAASLGGDIHSGTYANAVTGAEVIVLAVPWTAAQSVLATLGPLGDVILIDPINALGAGGVALPNTTSAAEQIAGWADGGRVVKAFNTIYFERLDQRRAGDRSATLPICGDDANAKATVAQLGAELGFDPVDCGNLAIARLIEPLAALWIHLAFTQGMGPELTFKFL